MCWRATRATFVAKAAYTRTLPLFAPGSVTRRLSVASASCISAASPRNRGRYASAVGTRSRMAKRPAWWGILVHCVVSSGNGYPPRDTGGNGTVASWGRCWAPGFLGRIDCDRVGTRGRGRRAEASVERGGWAGRRDMRASHFLCGLVSGIECFFPMSSHGCPTE